jgi:hypothetical protein
MKYVIWLAGGFIEFALLLGFVNSGLNLFRRYGDSAALKSTMVVLGILSILWGALVWYLATRSPETWRVWWEWSVAFAREEKTWLIGTAIAFTVGIVSMGLMGIPSMYLGEAVVQPLIATPLAWKAPHGDTSWPMLLGYAALLPWIAFASHLAIKKFFSTMTMPTHAAVVITATAILSLVVHVLYRFSNRHG